MFDDLIGSSPSPKAPLIVDTVDKDSSMGSVLVEMLKKLVSAKNSFIMERYAADKEEDSKALQLRP